jgi:hypothetical protein
MLDARRVAVALTLVLSTACGEQDSPSNNGGAGSPGSGGSNASGGSAGSAGSQTSGGSGGSAAGSGGSGGGNSSGGSGGSGGSAQGGSGGSGGQASSLSFFATSKGSGDLGGNIGGLDGADAICQGLAEAAGAGDRVWHAYISTDAEDARNRIGDGPWFNAAGDMVAANVESLHTDGLSNGDPQHVMDENGDAIPSSEHDILTGSDENGMAVAETCVNWTSNDPGDQAQVGHSDIPADPQFSPSWNAAHTANCDPDGLDQVGGAGRLYCFASD